VRDVDALVALQPDQAPAKRLAEDLRALGLADAGLALKQQRLAERKRDGEDGGETSICEVGALAETVRYLRARDQDRRKISKRT
jgi:hypothetical protein